METEIVGPVEIEQGEAGIGNAVSATTANPLPTSWMPCKCLRSRF